MDRWLALAVGQQRRTGPIRDLAATTGSDGAGSAITAVAIATVVLVLGAMVVAAYYVGRGRGRTETSSGDDEWLRRADVACREAQTIVDLTAVAGGRDLVEPTTIELSSVSRRASQLALTLHHLHREGLDARLDESISDTRESSLRLAAAIEAERSLRVAAQDVQDDERLESAQRIARRAAELDLAVRELSGHLDGGTWPKTTRAR